LENQLKVMTEYREKYEELSTQNKNQGNQIDSHNEQIEGLNKRIDALLNENDKLRE